ncbi:hypothetical protein V2G26_014055 [Clonostachys chloroleuca]
MYDYVRMATVMPSRSLRTRTPRRSLATRTPSGFCGRVVISARYNLESDLAHHHHSDPIRHAYISAISQPQDSPNQGPSDLVCVWFPVSYFGTPPREERLHLRCFIAPELLAILWLRGAETKERTKSPAASVPEEETVGCRREITSCWDKSRKGETRDNGPRPSQPEPDSREALAPRSL